MGRLWSFFRPSPPAPLEERIAPSASAPLVDASAIDALFAGLPSEPSKQCEADGAASPPPPELPPPPPELPTLTGEVRGEVIPLPHDSAHAFALRGQGPLRGADPAELDGTLTYDDPTCPPEAPRVEGNLRITWADQTLSLRLASLERRSEPSLLFPRDFRVWIEPGSIDGHDVTEIATATLTLHTPKSRRKQPVRQIFTLSFSPVETPQDTQPEAIP